MRTLYFALLGSCALIPSALAQTQPQQQGQPGPACDRLLIHLEQRGATGGPVTLEQAKEFKSQNNQRRCEEALRQLRTAQEGAQQEQRAGGQQPADRQSEITVQQQPPVVKMDRAQPQVTVHQPQPQVSVVQPTPEIIVHQPAPTITIQQPQPTITVRMPEPQAHVTMPQPRVEVDVPKPQVSVLPPSGPPQVQAEAAEPRVTVVPPSETQPTVQKEAGQPTVRFEQIGEPKIDYRRAEGQPQIKFERAEDKAGDAQRRQAQAERQPARQQAQGQQDPASPQGQQEQRSAQQTQQQTGAQGRAITASQLSEMRVYNARGEQLGDVEKVILGRDNRHYIVIGHGGFLGLGEKQIVLHPENVRLAGDRLLVRDLTEEQIRALPEWNWPSETYQEVRGDTPINLQ